MADSFAQSAVSTDAFDTDSFDIETTEASSDPTDFGAGDFENFLDWRRYRLRRWMKKQKKSMV